MARAPLVLVVDDEGPIREIVRRYLQAEGIDVVEADDGPSAVERFTTHHPDVVVLDVMLPGFDGIEVLRRIRATSDAYVLMLTARTEETDRIIGLSVGADDYVTKPFSARELTARVKALLRRPHMADSAPTRQEFGRLSLDDTRREVLVDGTLVALSALEFDLLAALSAKPGQVLSRRQLLERVWGFDYFGDERVVDVHIRNLRRALGDDADAPTWIATVRGVGYKFLDATS
ncbi:MAG: response regulator transcription factor [Actinobacteria bacterium]|nr:response regulator transcription factor [Actinomycetota bacterium]